MIIVLEQLLTYIFNLSLYCGQCILCRAVLRLWEAESQVWWETLPDLNQNFYQFFCRGGWGRGCKKLIDEKLIAIN